MCGVIENLSWRVSRFRSITTRQERVIVECDDYMTSIIFTPARARQLARSLIREADRAEAVSPTIGTAA